MNARSSLRRFVVACRDFGPVVALRVACSNIRGRLRPALALPGAPVYDDKPRELSILLGGAEHDAVTLEAVIDLVAGHDGADWEVCICARPPLRPETAAALARHLGTRPWIRVVTADAAVDAATAARWTVEQATGQFVALLAPGYRPAADALQSLLACLRDAPEFDAAALVAAGSSRAAPAAASPADCRLVLQRKRGYLTCLPGRALAAPALVEHLRARSVPTAYVAAASKPAIAPAPPRAR